MQPVKAKEHILILEEQKKIPAKDITDMVNGYYIEFKEKMMTLEHIRMEIPGLGIMSLRPNMLKDDLDILQPKASVLDQRTEKYMQLKILERGQDMVDWEKARRDKKRAAKLAHRNKKNSNDTQGETTGSLG